ncbi:MAG: DUF4870 domain-containing protein [bacterium]|nr:DUF4870 domain-containing protein [bacterium]
MSEHVEPAAQSEPQPGAEPKAAIPKEARNWAMACHMMALVGLLGNGIGLLVGPLVVWLIKREEHPFIDEQGKEAINFQLTMMGALFLSAILIFAVIGILLLPLVGLFTVVMAIVGGIKAANGEHFRYPLTIRLIK